MAGHADALDLGKLLRMHAMVTSAQVEATARAGHALVRAYTGLVAEMDRILEADGLEALREEFMRLFKPLAEAPAHHDRLMANSATEALVNLRQLGGWIQGLIEELTFEQRMRMEAEERAKLGARPSTGFSV